MFVLMLHCCDLWICMCMCSKETIWKGPEHATVEDVKYSDEREIGGYEYEGFEVVRRKK